MKMKTSKLTSVEPQGKSCLSEGNLLGEVRWTPAACMFFVLVFSAENDLLAGNLQVLQASSIQCFRTICAQAGVLPPKAVEKKEAPKVADEKKDGANKKVADEKNELSPEIQTKIQPKDTKRIQRLFQKLFAPGIPFAPNADPNDNAGDGEKKTRELGATDRDQIDSRAPHDSRLEQQMRAAEEAVKKGDWKDAIDLLQRLLDHSDDSLYRQPDGRWLSLRRSASRLIGKMPSEVLDAYQRQYGGLAAQLLLAARRTGRVSDYVQVASRYFHTPSGFEAANFLGTLHFDRGEYGLAVAWFEDILASGSALKNDPSWRLKVAAAQKRAGNSEAAAKLISQTDGPSGESIKLGSGKVSAQEWLESLSLPISRFGESLPEWKQPFGNASRTGKAVGGEPLLSPLWSVSLTGSNKVKLRVRGILQDLLDQGRTPILAAMPLVLGGRAIYRDLRGVRSVDLETGRTVWESIEGVSPERIVGGLPPQQVEPREAWRFRGNFVQNDMAEYQGQAAEHHPLASHLFRDGTYNLISSDGRQVFVIEDHGVLSRNQPGQHWGWENNGENQDQNGVSWKTNRLVSYDLKSGRPIWSIGGIESKESFDLPLAGAFFHGVPVVDGDELLIVAGKADEVRLWSLDRATGVPRWSQLIAYSDTKIEQDVGRRWFNAQVATEGGIAICPTTVGWLVAVDRLRQSVLWAHRYVPVSAAGRHERDPASQFVPQRELNAQWPVSAPMVSGGVVVYTPQEEPVLVALSVLDGKRLWEKQKEDWLYVAGVFDDRVLLVGKGNIASLALETGKVMWNLALEGEGRPSGRSIVVGDNLFVPLSNGELRTVDIKQGKVVHQTYVPSRHPALGNLAMHQGKLVTLGPGGLVVFGQREALLAEISRRKAINPNDSWALLREAEVHLLNRSHSESLPILRAIKVESLTEDERGRLQNALVESLAAVVRGNLAESAKELEELAGIAATPDEVLLHHDLVANKLVAEGKLGDAFDSIWDWAIAGTSRQETKGEESAAGEHKAASSGKAFIGKGGEHTLFRSDELFARTEDPHVEATLDTWVSGRLLDIWASSSGDERTRIDARVASIVKALRLLGEKPEEKSADVNSLSSIHEIARSAELLSFHPDASSLREIVIDRLSENREFGAAQIELLRLAGEGNPNSRARAVLRLAQLMFKAQLPADANYYLTRLDSEFAAAQLVEGETMKQSVTRLRSEMKLDGVSTAPKHHWDDRPIQTHPRGTQYVPPTQEMRVPLGVPYYRPLSVELHPQEQRIGFESIVDGSLEWLAPLRGSVRHQGDSYVYGHFLGHEIALVNRDVLHVVSPIERRVLWAKPLDTTGEGAPFWRHASRPTPSSMTTATVSSGGELALLQSAQHTGRLAVVRPEYICYYGRRSITVIDSRTGAVRWKKEGLAQQSKVIGTRDLVFIVPTDQTKIEAFRARDGKPLRIAGLASILSRGLAVHGDSILVAQVMSSLQFLGLGKGRGSLRMFNPETGVERWKVDAPSGAFIELIDSDEVFVLAPDGKTERIGISDGRRLPMDPVPSGAAFTRRADECFVLADEERVYLVSNTNDQSGVHHYGESLPSIRVNGMIYAWNRANGKLIWHQEVKRQNMIVDRFRAMPILLFVSRSWELRGNTHMSTLSLKAINKFSGKVLLDTSGPSSYNGFHSVAYSPLEPSVELKSYNLRLKLVPSNGPVIEAKPETMPDSSKK